MKKGISVFNLILSLSAVFFIWKGAAIIAGSPVLPHPEAVIAGFIEQAKHRYFWFHFMVSGWRVCSSIILSWIMAFPLGALLGYNRSMDRIFAPLIFMAYPVPKMVLLPIVVLLFGLGDLSKIILITMILFFQILVSVRDGVKAINRKYYDSIKSMGGGTGHIILHAIIPAALPHSFTAIRISAGTAISVLFFTESFATTTGLGFMIMDAWAKAEYTQIFTGITGMSIMGFLLYIIFTVAETSLCPWNIITEDESRSKATIVKRIVTFSKMIKFSHTVFALPFALSGLVLARRVHPVSVSTVLWIIVAMAGARSAAMGFNRIADAAIDSENPRTASREIPAGVIGRGEAMIFTLLSSLLLVCASAMLSRLCFMLSFPLLAFLFFYSYTKRFTWLAHIYLGFAIGLAPVAVWIAIAGVPRLSVIILSLVLMTHIAGFDILYSCQDLDFDIRNNLFSIPSRFGIKTAFFVSSILHTLSVLLLVSIYFITGFGWLYIAFTGIIAVLFIIEHRIVRPDDISRIDIAFFHINSAISVLVFIAVLTGSITGG